MGEPPSPLRYLSAADVARAMPGVAERLELARRTMIGLVADAELPPKFGVHPRQEASLAHAMPALLRGAEPDGSADLLGLKWVTVFPENRSSELDAIFATVLLNDGRTGLPLAILDGRPITAQRTAAVSGVAIQQWWPSNGASIALLGAGAQGAAHLEVLAHVTSGCTLAICDNNIERAEQLATTARATGRFASVATTSDPPKAVSGANVVLTMVSFGPDRQILPRDSLADASLIVAVDYDMCVPAVVARHAATFLVDDVAQFLATRAGAVFRGYPDPDGSIGQGLLGLAPAPRATGPTLVNHLGVGLADVIFADAISRRAAEMDIGRILER
jgi:ornithine cyclodeaminase/alanine dehydrogenase-like protein (mu-crystallin family)